MMDYNNIGLMREIKLKSTKSYEHCSSNWPIQLYDGKFTMTHGLEVKRATWDILIA